MSIIVICNQFVLELLLYGCTLWDETLYGLYELPKESFTNTATGFSVYYCCFSVNSLFNIPVIQNVNNHRVLAVQNSSSGRVRV